MSSTVEVAQVEKSAGGLPWSLWMRQVAAILRLEVKKNFLSRRAILIYLLALLPIMLVVAMAVFGGSERTETNVLDAQGRVVQHSVRERSGPLADFNQYPVIFSALYSALILRTVVFFGCAWIFMNLFRGELVDRSLHFYFLSALRREVLVAGKYVSGLLTSIILFTSVTAASMLIIYFGGAYHEAMRFFFSGPGLGQLFTYMSITVLACIGYGAFFLVIGLFFRNPIIPALVLYGWEWLNFLLPPLLKKISVIHYLQSLTPVPLSEGPFAIVAEPTPAWISVPCLLLVTAAVLVGASLRIRRMEIRYGSE
jgi:ABC-type transport system involved in multi-copper enzyme maturation permease subunit